MRSIKPPWCQPVMNSLRGKGTKGFFTGSSIWAGRAIGTLCKQISHIVAVDLQVMFQCLHNVFVYIILWRISPCRVDHTVVVPGKIFKAPVYICLIFTGPVYCGLQIIRYNGLGDAPIKM